MLTLLFWNIKANARLLPSIVRLVATHQVDVLMLAESGFYPDDVLRSLNSVGGQSEYYHSVGKCRKIQLFSRFSQRYIMPVSTAEHHRFTVRRVDLPLYPEFLLIGVHLPDKRNARDEGQSMYVPQIAARVLAAENIVEHRRTVIIGDFNMDPFEAGMVSATGLHSVPTRRLAERQDGERRIYEDTFYTFYNPMWQHWGDRNDTPAGTYYHEASDPVRRYWHMFDQVLLRPALLPFFDDGNLQILSGDGIMSFLNSSRVPDQQNASDHLPILLKLNL